jgi:hypothetical protein
MLCCLFSIILLLFLLLLVIMTASIYPSQIYTIGLVFHELAMAVTSETYQLASIYLSGQKNFFSSLSILACKPYNSWNVHLKY